MGRTAKKGIFAYTADGFHAVRVLDNSNIYGVMLAEMISNIFKEGMWFKALTPYMLILTNNDPIQVGNMLTLNGITRAFVGVVSGRMAINAYGVEAVWVVTGFIGLASIMINVVCLAESNIPAAYFLNFAWAIYNGLWNSCLETSWSKSIVRSRREDVNGARQITNKVTTSMGPLFSAAIFVYCGNSWNIELVQNVMLFGTGMTVFTVMLCFCFRSSEEIEQDIPLQEVDRIVFPADRAGGASAKEFRCEDLTMSSFVFEDTGCVKLTYPIGHDGDNDKWDSRIKIVTSDFKDTDFILVKQLHATFLDVHPAQKTCVLCFKDKSRSPTRVDLKSAEIFLTHDQQLSVNRVFSQLHIKLNPSIGDAPQSLSARHMLSRLFLGQGRYREDGSFKSGPGSGDALQQALLAAGPGTEDEIPATLSQKLKGLKMDSEEPNMLGANVLVVCDVLNALGAGFSLKFMDLFLKVDYGVSPACIFLVAFLQNMFGAWLTPYAKALLNTMRERGYRAKLGVVLLWCSALFFLGVLCVPGMPLWVVLPSVVMMQSLNSCTRAYNRAALVNYLPREKIANYMAWDALNKANQGGVSIFGAQVVAVAGYRGCFVGTFIIFTIRMLIYLAFTLRKGTVRRGSIVRTTTTDLRRKGEQITEEDMNLVESSKGFDVDGEEQSQMFQPSQALAMASEKVHRANLVQVEAIDAEAAFSNTAAAGGHTCTHGFASPPGNFASPGLRLSTALGSGGGAAGGGAVSATSSLDRAAGDPPPGAPGRP